MANGEDRQGVQSLEKGIGVLLALSNAREPLRLGEVAEAAGMSRSKVHAYLTSLVRTGMAAQDPLTSRYALGETVLRIGISALRRIDLFTVAREALIKLQRKTGQTAFLTTWTSQGPLIVDKVDAAVESAYTLQMGVILGLYPTASGRLFMAFLPAAKWQPLYQNASGVSDLQVQAELDDIRSQGLAIVDPPTLPGYTVFAAPVFGRDGVMTAALCVAAPIGKLDKDAKGPVAVELRAAAAQASELLGFNQTEG